MPAIPLRMCLSGPEITDVMIRPGHRWVSGVLSIPGNPSTQRLCMWNVDDPSRIVELLAEPTPSAGRGLSGGAHSWNADGTKVVVTTKSAGVVSLTIDNDHVMAVTALGLSIESSWSTPVFIDDDNVHVVANWCELWCAPVDGGAGSLVRRTDGFLMDAVGRASGEHLTWDRPHMPWTESRIHPHAGRAGVAVQQPRTTHDGRCFGWIDDSHGTMNIRLCADHIVDHDVVIDDECEHGGPTWGPGQRTWCFSPDGRCVAYSRNDNGFGSLWVYDRVSGSRHSLGRGIHGCVSWDGDIIVALRSGARTPQQVVAYDVSEVSAPSRRILLRPSDGEWFDSGHHDELIEPEVHSVDTDGVEVTFRLYRSPHEHVGLIVWVHGGPNDQWQVTFRPRLVYWLSRGWTIAVVDHRGTTGHGREFTLALDGHWGEVDSIDTYTVLRRLQDSEGFAPQRTVLMGASAGGLTALNTAAFEPSHVAGVVVSYPVVDLAELMRGDDPFETHHVPTLVGAVDTTDPLVARRSPLAHASALSSVPILVFHGDSDMSVPLVHSEKLRDAVNSNGGRVALVVMPGEGHGFRDAANIGLEFSTTEEFLTSVIS